MRPTPRSLLAALHLPALLVSDLTNIRYVTGLDVSSGLLLVTPRAFTLFLDSRYLEMGEAQAYPDVAIAERDQWEMHMKKVSRCGFESENVTISRLSLWKRKLSNTKFVQSTGVIEEFRRRKDVKELQYLRRAQRITEELLRRIPSRLRIGVTEREVAIDLRRWAEELGADGLSFDPIVAFGTHTSRPHHHPTVRKLKKGHLVQIDVGARFRGYCADRSAVYFTAPPTPLQKKVLTALEEAKSEAKKAVKVGASTHTIDRIARDVLRRHGLDPYFTHSLGHGVGLEIHEGVTLSQKALEQRLLRNEVITIEPGVYLPGKFGMRLEDMVFVLS